MDIRPGSRQEWLQMSDSEVSQQVSGHTSSMKVLSKHVQVTAHTPEAVYNLWAHPAAWTEWDPDVAEVRFSGEPELGAKGWMRPTSGPAARFKIAALDAGRHLTTTSSLPGAVLSFGHALEPVDRGSRIAVTISVAGPLSVFWGVVLRKSFADSAPRNIAALVAYLDAA